MKQPSTGLLPYWSGTPESGTFNPLVLLNANQPGAPQLSGRRFVRFQISLRNNAVTNARQSYTALGISLTQ